MPAGALPPRHRGKVSSVASPSSVGIVVDAFVASSVAIKLALAVSFSDVFVAVALVIGRGSVVLAPRLFVIVLRLLVLALRSLVLLTSEATLRPPGLALRCVCLCRLDPLFGVPRIPMLSSFRRLSSFVVSSTMLLSSFKLHQLCLCRPSFRLAPLMRGLNASLEIFLPVLCMRRRLHALESFVLSEDVAPPVVEILPEMQDPCRESPMVLPVELGLVESLAVDMVPSPPSSESSSSSLSDRVEETVVVAPISEALFGKQICDLLVNLEAACPGYGKDIACVLTGTASDGVFMKVEKSLRRRARKKIGIARKASPFS